MGLLAAGWLTTGPRRVRQAGACSPLPAAGPAGRRPGAGAFYRRDVVLLPDAFVEVAPELQDDLIVIGNVAAVEHLNAGVVGNTEKGIGYDPFRFRRLPAGLR